MENAIKVILSILFFVCLIDLPYGYYQFVRFAALVGFLILAYQASGKANRVEMVIYICLSILFQPIFKISLGREIWNVVDVIVGLGLLVSIFIIRKKISSE
jgi:hypothetical protein